MNSIYSYNNFIQECLLLVEQTKSFANFKWEIIEVNHENLFVNL
jgi:hypothetical protein